MSRWDRPEKDDKPPSRKHLALCGHWCLCTAPTSHEGKRGGCTDCRTRVK